MDLRSSKTDMRKPAIVPRDLLLSKAAELVKHTDTVADIGCGIVPMNYFRPKLHFMIEPWKEYSDILSYRHRDDKSVVVLRVGALEALRAFADRSIDSIFLLDVIEHLPKAVGLEVLTECERVAREQIVVFTPLGFMPQHMEAAEKDGWGLSGTSVQEHLSGWTPEDFGPAWTFLISEDFHQVDFRGSELAKAHGAFFAIRNLDALVEDVAPDSYSDLRRPLPSELEVERLQQQCDRLENQRLEMEAGLRGLREAYEGLLYSRGVRILLGAKKMLRVGRR